MPVFLLKKLYLTNLKISNLRLISNLEFSPDPGINIFYGSNGAGKTTLLESIYLLARNRCFRSSSSRNLIKSNQKQLTIKTSINYLSGYTQHLSLKKTSSKTLYTINGQRQKKLTIIAKALPIGIVTPNSHRLIEEGPENRRRLLDWAVFHVEHDYQKIINDYRKVLMQRNSALQIDTKSINVWNKQLAMLSQQITSKRIEYLEHLSKNISILLNKFFSHNSFTFSYLQGWDNKLTFEESLAQSFIKDKEKGYTSVGPHRADMQIRYNDRPAKETLSRGQQKIIATLLALTNMSLLRNNTNESGVFLFDDIHAELDEQNLHELMNIIKSEKLQTFMTTTRLDQKNLADDSFKMFHVEQGEIV